MHFPQHIREIRHCEHLLRMLGRDFQNNLAESVTVCTWWCDVIHFSDGGRELRMCPTAYRRLFELALSEVLKIWLLSAVSDLIDSKMKE